MVLLQKISAQAFEAACADKTLPAAAPTNVPTPVESEQEAAPLLETLAVADHQASEQSAAGKEVESDDATTSQGGSSKTHCSLP